MKRVLLGVLALLFVVIGEGYATDITVRFYDAELPLLVNKPENIVCEIVIDSKFGGEIVNEIILTQDGILPGEGTGSRIFYSGTSSVLSSHTPSQAIHEGVRNVGGSQSFYCHPSYSIKKSEIAAINSKMVFPMQAQLVKGKNYFWVSFDLGVSVSLDTRFTLGLKGVIIDGKEFPIQKVKEKKVVHRTGYGLRQSGDNGVYSYRIPGLVTTNQGVLLAVYDVRHQTNIDLQEDIDIGMSRSLDGGKSWEPMKIIMPTVLFIGITNVLGIQILVPLGREMAVCISVMVGAVVDLMINAVCIPNMASSGAAFGTVIAELAVLVVQCWILRTQIRGFMKDVQWLKILTAVTVAAFLSIGVKALQIHNFLILCVSWVVFATVYGIILIILKENFVWNIVEEIWKKIRWKN